MGKDGATSGGCPPGFVLDPVTGLCVQSGGGGPIDLSGVINAINALGVKLDTLIALWTKQYEPGQVQGLTEFNPNGTVTNTGVIALYPAPKRVRRAVIVNLSSTDNFTVFASGMSARLSSSTTSGKGVPLNKVATGNLAGGSLTIGNVDLSAFSIISDTNSGQNVVVYSEI